MAMSCVEEPARRSARLSQAGPVGRWAHCSAPKRPPLGHQMKGKMLQVWSEGVDGAAASACWTPLRRPAACRAQSALPVASVQRRGMLSCLCRAGSTSGVCHSWVWAVPSGAAIPSARISLARCPGWPGVASAGSPWRPPPPRPSHHGFSRRDEASGLGGKCHCVQRGPLPRPCLTPTPSSGKVFFSWGGRRL